MCAAHFERPAFAFRNVCKQLAHEQSSTVAQSANEAGFIRKNSGPKSESFIRKNSGPKSEKVPDTSLQPRAAQGLHGRPQQPASVFPSRGHALRQQQRGARFAPHPRHVAADFLQAQASARSFSTVQDVVKGKGFVPLAAAVPREDRTKSGVSIDELMQIATEKYQLNTDFWGKYTDIPSMAQASNKDEILLILDNFVLIHRKHVYLFQRLKNTVLKNLAFWSAPDLAALCHSWAQLGFLHEDLCVAMAERVTVTAHTCNAQELCWLMDAYATARCSVRSVVQEISKLTLIALDDFTLQQLCLHASSFARLNIIDEALFKAMATRIVQGHRGLPAKVALAHDAQDWIFSARDLTLAAYSFAKLGFCFPEVFSVIAQNAQEVIRDFTARDLQMIIVAFARAQYHNPDLLVSFSLQAQRRIAQFSAESLALLLRAFAFCDAQDTSLFTRAVSQLPRMILTFRPADVTTLLSAFAAHQVHSEALFDIVTPFILEKAPMFTPSDWTSALRSYSALGNRDVMFLYAMTHHLEASRLSLRQLSSVMADCSRLSFAGHSELLAKAAAAKLEDEGDGALACPADIVGQMYTALLLLGHSAAEPERLTESTWIGSSTVISFLKELSSRLRGGSTLEELSPATRVNLCYALLLAPPVRGCGRHPVTTASIMSRCLAESSNLALEEQLLLRHAIRAADMVSWNRQALRSTEASTSLATNIFEDACVSPPAPFFLTGLSHLAPLTSSETFSQLPSMDMDATLPLRPNGNAEIAGEWSSLGRRGAQWRGVFVAYEIYAALEELSQALTAIDVENRVVCDNETEAHVLLPHYAWWRLRNALAIDHPRSSLSTSSHHVDDAPHCPREKDVALIWGSTVHYICSGDNGSRTAAHVQPRLSPSAKFQAALLQDTRDVEVVIVPHWWWGQLGNIEDRGFHLARFLVLPAERAASQVLATGPPKNGERRRPPSHVE